MKQYTSLNKCETISSGNMHYYNIFFLINTFTSGLLFMKLKMNDSLMKLMNVNLDGWTSGHILARRGLNFI